MECLFFGFVILIVLIYIIIEKTIEALSGNKKRKSKHSSYSKNYLLNTSNRSKESLPNGYTRQDYRDYGYSNADIEYWGFDQPGAPSPSASGYVIDNMLDGHF